MPVPVRLLVLALLLGSSAIAGARAAAADGLAERLAALGGAPCADSGLTCVTLALPHDHAAGDNGPTVEVTFAVSPATLPSLGTLFYAVGGPGGSGLAVAEDYLAAYDPELVAALDIVFFDQRGVGPVHGVACPDAEAAFYLTELPVERPEVAFAAARDFVAACTAETGDTTLLPFVATEAAARDLELFRAAIGSPPVWVYGESYGTQLAQTYATMFPAAVRGVILDGVVDLTLGFEAFYADYTVAAERLLERTLVEQRLVKEPANRVINYGVHPPTVMAGSTPMSYVRKMRVWATWYDASHGGKPRSSPAYGLTALGVQATQGIMAVDPSVIPYRTRAWVPGYGVAVAMDTGGGIRGNMIDLAFDEDAPKTWTTRYVDIYLLGLPSQADAYRTAFGND